MAAAGSALKQHLDRRFPVHQLASPSLGKSRGDLRGHGLALFTLPMFEVELLADDLESLVENLVRILVCAGPDGQIDHSLLARRRPIPRGEYLTHKDSGTLEALRVVSSFPSCLSAQRRPSVGAGWS